MNTCRSVCLLALLMLPCAALPAQKTETWIEVRSPNFTVVSNASEKQARSVAEQFELFRALVKNMLPQATVDLGKPLTILAVKNEKHLKELLPEFWEEKNRVHPAGMFVGSDEKMYVALRMDVYGDYPYQVIYHELMHAILRRNFQDIPLWLNEGFAELFGYSALGSKKAGVGRPSEGHLYQLQQQKLLPVEVLLTVDHKSPHYNEKDRASVFYAQSWALTHFLMLAEGTGNSKQLQAYLQNVAKGMSEKDAAAATFGDLDKFNRTLEAYTRRSAFFYYVVNAPADIDEKSFPVRALSPAESAALRGDFHVHMNRPKEARALLDEALRLDPENAQAYESIGVLYLRNREQQEASEWFEKAAARDSKSFLAHYYAAMLGVQRGAPDAMFEKTEKHLRRALELNPQFAPAYSTLASFYAFREGKLEDALQLAQKAARLEPGTLHYHLNVANILMRMRRMDEAIRIGEKVQAAAREPSDRLQADEFLRNAREFRESNARYEAARRLADERAARVAAEMAAERPSGPAPEADTAPELTLDPSGSQAIARGLVTQVMCTDAAAMQLTLRLRRSSLTLRAAQRAQVAYYVAPSEANRIARAKLRQFDPCKALPGQRVEIVYKPEKQTLSGEIMSVELLPSPPTEVMPTRSEPSAPPAQPPPSNSPRVGWAEGRVSAVSCIEPLLYVVIDLGGGYSLRLRAENYHKLEFSAAPGVNLPDGFQPCTQMKNLNVEAKYHVAASKNYAGDVVSILIRK